MRLLLRKYIVLVPLLLISSPSGRGADLRIIFPARLADVTVAKESGPNSSYSNYWISGQVETVYPKCVLLTRPGEVRFVYAASSSPDLLFSSSTDLLGEVAASRLSGANGISLGNYLALSPEMRKRFVQQRTVERLAVFNLQKPELKTGEQIQEFALPLGKINLSGVGEVLGYDCGMPYEGEIKTNKYILVAEPAKLVQKQLKLPVQKLDGTNRAGFNHSAQD